MNFTKALTMVLAGVMAVSPMQFLTDAIVQSTENVTEETTSVTETVSAGSVVTGDSAIGGFSLIINKFYESIGCKWYTI